MPYIPQTDRDKIEQVAPNAINLLSEVLQTFDINKRKGPCNYVISSIVLKSMKDGDKEWSYHTISNAVSVLRDAATEIERRLMGPRENQAILKNGDLKC